MRTNFKFKDNSFSKDIITHILFWNKVKGFRITYIL
uniref:Uncharacterized protein n=1 Tax=Rhizophora mucronata TaxID=61149 RepID=A0A2P2NG47_RHIMU